MSKLTKRITAMLLAGMLVIGSVPGSVLAASTDVDPGQTSEIAEEVFDEESSEVPASEEKTGEIEETSEDPVGAGETTQVEDISEVPAGEGKTTESEEIFEEPASAWETAEEASVQYYTITLDANGGYFENEWDDSIGDYAQQAEVVVKQIPVDGTVAAFPVANDQDGQTMVFTGWSLERDGELITMGDEEYAPVDNCVLYAVWKAAEAEDAGVADTEQETEAGNEDTETGEAAQEYETAEESAQESEDIEVAEDANAAQETIEDTDTAPETDNEQDTAPAQEVNNSDEDEVETSEEELGSGEEAADASEEEDEEPADVADDGEPVTEEEVDEDLTQEDGAEAALDGNVIASGTCGDSLNWTLEENVDGSRTLTISGSGEMHDYITSDVPWLSEREKINTVVVEDGVTYIGNCAFNLCFSLTNISIPDSVTSIGSNVFDGCDSLDEIHINSLEAWLELSTEDSALSGNIYLNDSPLTNVDIPDGITEIRKDAFRGCISLTNITILDSVTSIGENAFNDCSSLESITLSNQLTSIGDYAFWGCRCLESITLSNELTSIGDYAFGGCISLERITIPDSVKRIEKHTFLDCSSLQSITLPNNLESIGECAFQNCTSLTSITIPDSVSSLDDDAFDDYSGEIRVYAGSYAETFVEDHNLNYRVICKVHSWNEKYTVDKAATCTEEGSKSKHCSVCDIIDETTVRAILKKDHAYGNWTVTKDVTCTEDGSREKVCADCGDKVTETISAKGHVWSEDLMKRKSKRFP